MRRMLGLILAMVMAFNLAVFATEGGTQVVMEIDKPTMWVNNVEASIDEEGTAPVIINGRTLVPIRAIIEALGGEVTWDGTTRQATLSHGNNIIVLTINSGTAYLNDVAYELDSAPVIINSRTMLPIRFVAESFGFNVDWDGEAKRVTIIKQSEEEAQQTVAEVSTEAVTEETSETSTEATTEPTTEATTELTTEETTEAEETGSSLIVYYSRTGNTESLAETIQSVTGGDIIRVETVEPYPESYNEVVDIADKELSENARPEITTVVENMEEYDTIYIGYPIWWGTMPMAMFTFIEAYDLSGKTIAPFCTSASTGIGTSVEDIRESLPDSNVTEGFRGSSSTTRAEIEEWISGFNS